MIPLHHIPVDDATATAWLKTHGIGEGNLADEGLALRWNGTAWTTPDWYRVVYRCAIRGLRTPEIEEASGMTRGGLAKVKAKYPAGGVDFPYVSRPTLQALIDGAAAAAAKRAAYRPVIVRGTHPVSGTRTTVYTDIEAEGVASLVERGFVRDV